MNDELKERELREARFSILKGVVGKSKKEFMCTLKNYLQRMIEGQILKVIFSDSENLICEKCWIGQVAGECLGCYDELGYKVALIRSDGARSIF